VAGVLVEPHATTTRVVARPASSSRPEDIKERIDSLLKGMNRIPKLAFTVGRVD
jgi:hypothetical protein